MHGTAGEWGPAWCGWVDSMALKFLLSVHWSPGCSVSSRGKTRRDGAEMLGGDLPSLSAQENSVLLQRKAHRFLCPVLHVSRLLVRMRLNFTGQKPNPKCLDTKDTSLSLY